VIGITIGYGITKNYLAIKEPFPRSQMNTITQAISPAPTALFENAVASLSNYTKYVNEKFNFGIYYPSSLAL